MRKLFAAIALCFAFCASALAQVTCGPYTPFARVINPDGTERVYAYVSCQNPDPANWSHTYTLQFPSVLTYYDGTVLNFVGNASAQVFGHNDCVSSGRAGGSCGHRLVTVQTASLTDPTGVSVTIIKRELGSVAYPVDDWVTTSPLAPDTLYSFAVSGTNNYYTAPGITDTLYLEATYVLAAPPAPPPPPPPCDGCGSD